MLPAEPFHLFSEILEPREHPLESCLLYDHYFHIPVNLSLTLIFITKRNEEIMPSQPFPEAKKIKKSRRAANRTRGVTGRHPFSPSGCNSEGENRKGHTYFFEAKVAVPHRGARPGPCGSAWKKSSSLRSGIFSSRALTTFRWENGCKAYKETRVPVPRAGCLTDKSKRIWQQKT